MFIIKAVAKILSVVMIVILSISNNCGATTLLKSAATRNTTASISNYSSLISMSNEKVKTSKDGGILKDITLTQSNSKTVSKENTINEEVYKKDRLVVQTINYNPDNLRDKSNLSKEQIATMLDGCDLEVLADYYYEMENKYSVNAIFLMALNIEESGYGTSYLAQNNNNLGGVTLRSGGYATFESWNECLDYIASLIDKMYLSEDGAYYNGQSIYGVNVKYCAGGTWAENLNTIAYELLNKVEPTVAVSNDNFINR